MKALATFIGALALTTSLAGNASADLTSQVVDGLIANCNNAIAAANKLQPGLQTVYTTYQNAKSALAPLQNQLHLASLSLNNTDCAAKPNTPMCVQLNAAYNTARDAVLQKLPAAQDAENAYTRAVEGYNAALTAANNACLNPELIQAAPEMIQNSAEWTFYQGLLTTLQKVVANAAASVIPDASFLTDLSPPAPSVAAAQFAGTYLFRGVAGQTAFIVQNPDGTIVATTEKGEQGQGKVLSQNTFNVNFPALGGMTGTLNADGSIKWSNGETWVRQR